MYDEGEGNNCKGAEVEGVVVEDMVPDQCLTRYKAKKQTGNQRVSMHAEGTDLPRGHREVEGSSYMSWALSGYIANERVHDKVPTVEKAVRRLQ